MLILCGIGRIPFAAALLGCWQQLFAWKLRILATAYNKFYARVLSAFPFCRLGPAFLCAMPKEEVPLGYYCIVIWLAKKII